MTICRAKRDDLRRLSKNITLEFTHLLSSDWLLTYVRVSPVPCSSTNDVSGAYSSKALSDTLDKDPILLQQSTVLAIIILRPLASLENSLQSTSLNTLIRNEQVTITFKTANFRFIHLTLRIGSCITTSPYMCCIVSRASFLGEQERERMEVGASEHLRFFEKADERRCETGHSTTTPKVQVANRS